MKAKYPDIKNILIPLNTILKDISTFFKKPMQPNIDVFGGMGYLNQYLNKMSLWLAGNVPNAHATLLYVVDKKSRVGGIVQQKAVNSGRVYLEAARNTLQNFGISVETKITVGNPVSEIAKAAKEDWIILAGNNQITKDILKYISNRTVILPNPSKLSIFERISYELQARSRKMDAFLSQRKIRRATMSDGGGLYEK
jgi:hypothetical protein